MVEIIGKQDLRFWNGRFIDKQHFNDQIYIAISEIDYLIIYHPDDRVFSEVGLELPMTEKILMRTP